MKRAPTKAGYIEDATATNEAIASWRTANPDKTPTIEVAERTAIMMTLLFVVRAKEGDAVSKRVTMNAEARELAEFVAERVPYSTWNMFAFGWKLAYGPKD